VLTDDNDSRTRRRSIVQSAIREDIARLEQIIDRLPIDKMADSFSTIMQKLAVLEARQSDIKNISEEHNRYAASTQRSIETLKDSMNQLEKQLVYDHEKNVHQESTIDAIKQSLETKYVSMEQFAPIKNIVYTIITLVVTGVIGSLINMVVIKH